jgi:hypothetical protein
MTPRQRAEQIGQDDISSNRATKHGHTNDNVNGKGRVGTSASLHAFPTSSRNDRYLPISLKKSLIDCRQSGVVIH